MNKPTNKGYKWQVDVYDNKYKRWEIRSLYPEFTGTGKPFKDIAQAQVDEEISEGNPARIIDLTSSAMEENKLPGRPKHNPAGAKINMTVRIDPDLYAELVKCGNKSAAVEVALRFYFESRSM